MISHTTQDLPLPYQQTPRYTYSRVSLRVATFLCAIGLSLSPTWAQNVPQGFEMTTFAKPPEVTYPTGLAVAPNGYAFVSCDLNSSLDTESKRGSIVRCYDSDGDKIADQFTTFVADIDSPRGLCFVGETLYVVNPPFLTAFRDHDNDGVADEKVNLIEGMGFDLSFRGADHTSNGVRMGIDGWLYLAIGDYGMHHAVAKDGSTMHLYGGGVLRIRPDGSELELHTANTRNIVDVAVSPMLDVFSRDNTNDGKGWNTRFHHAMPLADMGYPRLYKNFSDEHLSSLADFGGGSGTAGYYLDEPGIPADYNDKVYTGDFTTRNVYVHPMKPLGATFELEQNVFFNVQAIDMDADGESQIYVCDWRGGNYRFGDPNVGSVTLISVAGLERPKFPNLKSATANELIQHVVSDSAVLRINAQSEILRRGKNADVSAGLLRQAADENRPLYGRIAALFTLKQLDGQRANKSIAKLVDSASLREFALRALADRKKESLDVPIRLFEKALTDSNPRVQTQAVVGLARIGATESADAILALAVPSATNDASQQAIAHVAAKAVIQLDAVQAALDSLEDPSRRAAGLRCLKELHSAQAVDGLISKLKSSQDKGLQRDILPVLFRLYHRETAWKGDKWWGTRPDDRGPYFELETWDQSEKIKEAIEYSVGKFDEETQGQLVIDMRRNRLDRQKFDLQGVVFDEAMALINHPNPGSTAIELLTKAAVDSKRPVATRIAAFNAVRRIPGSDSFHALLSILSQWNDDNVGPFKTVEREFIYSLEHSQKPKILRNALKSPRKGYPGQVVAMIAFNLLYTPLKTDGIDQETLQGYVKNHPRDENLLRAIGAMGLVKERDLVEKTIETAKPKIKREAKRVLAILDEIGDLSGDTMKQIGAENGIRQLITAKGHVGLGQQLFARQGCINCHTTAPSEVSKGPFLGNVGGKFKRDYLAQAIMTPSSIVAQGFQTTLIQTIDGKILKGFVTSEKDGVLELRDDSGIVSRILIDDIEEQKTSKISMMPEGLANNLTLRELASILDYLQSMH